MLTELDQEKQNRDRLKNGIRLCEESLRRAEKYERLLENTDFKDHLKDLRVIAEMHDREIKMANTMLVDAPSHPYVKRGPTGDETVVSSREDWSIYVMRHEVQRQDALRMAEEPEKIIAMARLARERLPILKDQLDKIPDHESTPTNGKS